MSEAWEQFERHVCMLVDGKRTPASGRLGLKGDIRTETLLIECKFRTWAKATEGMPLPDWLATIEYQARQAKRIPILALRLMPSQEGKPPQDRYFCRLVDLSSFLEEDTEDVRQSRKLLSFENWAFITVEELTSYCKKNRENEPVRTSRPARLGGPTRAVWKKRPFRK